MKIFATLARGSLLAYTGLFFAFIYIPLALIAVYSFNANPVNMMTWTGFTTDWYAQVLGFKTKISENALYLESTDQLVQAVWNSLRIAASTTATAEQAFKYVAKVGALATKTAEAPLRPAARVAPKAAAATAKTERHCRIALCINFAAIELRALFLVGQQVIGFRDVGEFLRRLRIFLVPVGMQLFCKLAISGFDFRFARVFRHAEGGIGICHLSPVAR